MLLQFIAESHIKDEQQYPYYIPSPPSISRDTLRITLGRDIFGFWMCP